MNTVMFDRKVYFDAVRASLFSGKLSDQQVQGQEAILGEWELPGQTGISNDDPRWLAYMLGTTYHETAQKMWPIEEYGKGAGMPYGVIDPVTGYAYYGRGYVQLTWPENYKKATERLHLSGASDLYYHPQKALDPQIAADVMFIGMREGWFRKSKNGQPETLHRYFNVDVDDAFTAREIINGDKNKVPSWSNGVSIGQLVKNYHGKFLTALNTAYIAPAPGPSPETLTVTINVTVDAPPGVEVKVNVIG